MGRRLVNFACSIVGCDTKQECRGLCAKHYSRLLRHGDPHIQGRATHKDVQAFLATLTKDGEGCVTWPFFRYEDGYGSYRGKLASAVICEMFHGKKPTPRHQAAHSCGKGRDACVAPWHLRWATPTENAQDRILHGTAFRKKE